MTHIKRLKDKLTSIADNIRDKSGETNKMTIDQMNQEIAWLESDYDETETYILVDEQGNEIAAVATDEIVEITATPNDIRLGTTAVTSEGIVQGEKEIPAYYVTEGARKITAGSDFLLKIRNGRYAYTKLQALFCVYSDSITSSVATDRVAINDSVYAVNSTDAIAEITLDDAAESILFNITNTGDDAYVLRYFSYKEEH